MEKRGKNSMPSNNSKGSLLRQQLRAKTESHSPKEKGHTSCHAAWNPHPAAAWFCVLCAQAGVLLEP